MAVETGNAADAAKGREWTPWRLFESDSRQGQETDPIFIDGATSTPMYIDYKDWNCSAS